MPKSYNQLNQDIAEGIRTMNAQPIGTHLVQEKHWVYIKIEPGTWRAVRDKSTLVSTGTLAQLLAFETKAWALM